MSVYTSILDFEFSEILNTYSLGDFISAQGIQAGIENTNYFLNTTKGDYVFTLFEKIKQKEINFYISLLQELSITGIACPQPQVDINNQTINQIKSKPFTIVSRLKGNNVTSVNLEQCNAIAVELAKLHTASLPVSNSCNEILQNRRGTTWRENTAKKLIKQLPRKEANLISNEMACYQSFNDSNLPKGIIHADLFTDNALFANNQLSGIIDFYDACYDNYIYDIAITVNAWCVDKSDTDKKGKLNEIFSEAFLQSYQAIRPLSDAEIKAWPMMLRMAAMRFWLSRLEDSLESTDLTSRKGILMHCKNPVEYQLILQNHIYSAVD